MWTRWLVPAVIMLAVLALASVAAADKEKVQLTAADQAKARSIALRLSDLGGAGHGWSGGIRTKPTSDNSLRCHGFAPKQSDLVLTGRAQSVFSNTGLEFDNEVELLRTERMVKLDWQRSVDAPGLLPCLRQAIAKTLPKGEKLVSLHRLAFPKLGDESAAFRGLVEVASGPAKADVMIDFALVGVGRSEITLITTALYADAAVVTQAEERLVQILAGRAAPPGAA